jgi:hypothetical protein
MRGILWPAERLGFMCVTRLMKPPIKFSVRIDIYFLWTVGAVLCSPKVHEMSERMMERPR